MKNVIELLCSLQELEMGPTPASSQNEIEIRRLREKIPLPILAHYDRLLARGKKGVAVVRHGVCPECHMSLASGVYAQLMRAEDVVICGNCGRYLLYRPEDKPVEPPLPEPVPTEPKKKTKGRKKKVAVTPPPS
jgi:predicted  nucleic acid-binding Zn-ribbon protein